MTADDDINLLADDAIEIEPGGPCCLCHEPIELGFMVVDEDGYRYCEGCWQP